MLRDGRRITAIDVNFWGVTFARDSDVFYATLATGGKTYLIKGLRQPAARARHPRERRVPVAVAGRHAHRIQETHRLGKQPVAADRARPRTMRETPLAETRSVDDQAEWLDDDTVLYGIGGSVWRVPADGSGTAQRFIPGADSPAVIHW